MSSRNRPFVQGNSRGVQSHLNHMDDVGQLADTEFENQTVFDPLNCNDANLANNFKAAVMFSANGRMVRTNVNAHKIKKINDQKIPRNETCMFIHGDDNYTDINVDYNEDTSNSNE